MQHNYLAAKIYNTVITLLINYIYSQEHRVNQACQQLPLAQVLLYLLSIKTHTQKKKNLNRLNQPDSQFYNHLKEALVKPVFSYTVLLVTWIENKCLFFLNISYHMSY